MDKISFEVPDFGFPVDDSIINSSEISNNKDNSGNDVVSLSDYLDMVKECDKTIQSLNEENSKLRLDNKRMKVAFSMIKVYINSI